MSETRSARCSICGVEKAKLEFSKNQWRLRGQRKCKCCMAGQPAATATAAPTTAGLLGTNIPIEVEVGRPRSIQELEKPDFLRRRIQELSHENFQLKVALAKNMKLTEDNIKLTEDNIRLTLQAKSLNALRTEVARLEKENISLKKEMASLKKMVAQLWKSHEIESKLAIRKLLDDAERLSDKSKLSSPANNFIAQHFSKLRQDGNHAAHSFPPDRIREAIKEFSGSQKTKVILIDLFENVCHVPFEEAETIHDDWDTELDESL